MNILTSSNRTGLLPILPPNAPTAGPYSPGMLTVGMGQTVYVSGQIALDPVTKQLVGTEIKAQTAQAINNIEAVLKTAHATLANVATVTVYLADLNDFAGMNEVFQARFPDPRPTRATVQVVKIPKDALVQIAATAFVPSPTLSQRISAYFKSLSRCH